MMQTFLGCDKSYEDADTVIFGAPFDSTTSYRPGARFGSRTMRAESYALETYSPYLDRDMADKAVCDLGELELCFGDSQAALDAIEQQTARIIADGKRPVMIGGEHLVSLGAIRAAAKAYPDLHVVHFDAHADLRDDYLGAPMSHAAVIRRVWDLLGDGRIYQFGIRSGDRPEFLWAAEGHVKMSKFGFGGLKETVLRLMDKPVYFTLDLDVLDPRDFNSAVGHDPDGVRAEAAIRLLADVAQAVDIVGLGITEYAPRDAMLLADMLRRLPIVNDA